MANAKHRAIGAGGKRSDFASAERFRRAYEVQLELERARLEARREAAVAHKQDLIVQIQSNPGGNSDKVREVRDARKRGSEKRGNETHWNASDCEKSRKWSVDAGRRRVHGGASIRQLAAADEQAGLSILRLNCNQYIASTHRQSRFARFQVQIAERIIQSAFGSDLL